MITRILRYSLGVMMMCATVSCFTGIENTKKITQKDVAKAEQKVNTYQTKETVYNNVEISCFPDWEQGRIFYVVDDNVKRIFTSSSAFDKDTLSLVGKALKYKGYTEGNVLDNEPSVNLHFTDGTNEYVYATKNTINDIKQNNINLQVPFLIDETLVDAYVNAIMGKDFYVRTPIWYDENGEMMSGKKFVKVRVLGVFPGDKVFPLKVKFETEDKLQAFVYMSTKQSSIQNRMFDNLFTESNPRALYPSISDEHWENIINGTVSLEMTKDQCRLSLGVPNTIQERPTNDGLQEYWFYTDGMYLVFYDGLLKQYRK